MAVFNYPFNLTLVPQEQPMYYLLAAGNQLLLVQPQSQSQPQLIQTQQQQFVQPHIMAQPQVIYTQPQPQTQIIQAQPHVVSTQPQQPIAPQQPQVIYTQPQIIQPHIVSTQPQRPIVSAPQQSQIIYTPPQPQTQQIIQPQRSIAPAPSQSQLVNLNLSVPSVVSPIQNQPFVVNRYDTPPLMYCGTDQNTPGVYTGSTLPSLPTFMPTIASSKVKQRITTILPKIPNHVPASNHVVPVPNHVVPVPNHVVPVPNHVVPANHVVSVPNHVIPAPNHVSTPNEQNQEKANQIKDIITTKTLRTLQQKADVVMKLYESRHSKTHQETKDCSNLGANKTVDTKPISRTEADTTFTLAVPVTKLAEPPDDVLQDQIKKEVNEFVVKKETEVKHEIKQVKEEVKDTTEQIKNEIKKETEEEEVKKEPKEECGINEKSLLEVIIKEEPVDTDESILNAVTMEAKIKHEPDVNADGLEGREDSSDDENKLSIDENAIKDVQMETEELFEEANETTDENVEKTNGIEEADSTVKRLEKGEVPRCLVGDIPYSDVEEPRVDVAIPDDISLPTDEPTWEIMAKHRLYLQFAHRKKMKRKGINLESCLECGKFFDSITHLTLHLRSHENLMPFSCHLCSKKFFNKSSFNSHRRTHTVQKEPVQTLYNCDECDRVFGSRSALRKHVKRHKAGLICGSCRKEFANVLKLSDHEANVHCKNGKKLVVCAVCSTTFVYKTDLREHIKSVHENESVRPHGAHMYRCRLCPKQFKHKQSLHKHGRDKHRGIYDEYDKLVVCAICSAAFLRKTDLREHIKAVHGKSARMYRCRLCPKQFKHKQSLHKHRKIKHKQNRKEL